MARSKRQMQALVGVGDVSQVGGMPEETERRAEFEGRLISEGRLGRFQSELSEAPTGGVTEVVRYWSVASRFPALPSGVREPELRSVGYVPATEVERARREGFEAGKEARGGQSGPVPEWWCWDASPLTVSRELEEIRGKKATAEEEVDWAMRNLGNRKARPSGAPSPIAWNLLKLAETDGKGFAKDFYHRIAMKRLGDEGEESWRDERREQFRVLEELSAVASDRKCLRCGGPV